MKLVLTVEVPSSADQTETLQQLLGSALIEQGITITTAKRYHVDVDLLNVVRVS